MIPTVDSLAALLAQFDCAMLTVIDAEGRPRTRPLAPVKAPFNGHLWLRAGPDPQPLADIGRGAEVSVAYGAPGHGPYITVYGWAIVLNHPSYVRSVWRAAGAKPSAQQPRYEQLICVTARAAELWDAASASSRRVFAFSGAHPVCSEEPVVPQEPAFTPRVAISSSASCAR